MNLETPSPMRTPKQNVYLDFDNFERSNNHLYLTPEHIPLQSCSESYYTLKKEVVSWMAIPQHEFQFKGSHKATMKSVRQNLYEKYSSSQDYYYSRDINDIIANNTTPATISFIDQETVLE